MLPARRKRYHTGEKELPAHVANRLQAAATEVQTGKDAMNTQSGEQFETVAVLGAGVIGASWTALYLAAGLQVRVFDTADDTAAKVTTYVENAWPVLEQLGLAKSGDRSRVSFHHRISDTVRGAEFVQESVPERIEVKHALYREIEPELSPHAIVASSASGLMVKELQRGWKNPGRFILGHPFNPPHLIPLVELLGNDQTEQGVLDMAETFYQRVGKVTIRVKKEVPAHVANRLQAALWKEAIHLVKNDVASVEDVDKAMWAGPGLRWAAMGAHMLFHLGAGAGGLGEFCSRYADSFHRWWDTLGDVQIDQDTIEELVNGIDHEAAGRSPQALAAERDALIVGFLKARQQVSNAE